MSTTAFLEVVNCDPSEVRDIPPDRRGISHAQHQGTSSKTVVAYFGKYKGQALADIPRDYLLWLVHQPPVASKSIEKFKAAARAHLATLKASQQAASAPRKAAAKKARKAARNHQRHGHKPKSYNTDTTYQDDYWAPQPGKQPWRPRHP